MMTQDFTEGFGEKKKSLGLNTFDNHLSDRVLYIYNNIRLNLMTAFCRLLKLLSNISTAIMSENSSKPPSGAGASSSSRNNADPFASLLGGSHTTPGSSVAGSSSSQPTVKPLVKDGNVFLPNQLKLAVEVQ